MAPVLRWICFEPAAVQVLRSCCGASSDLHFQTEIARLSEATTRAVDSLKAQTESGVQVYLDHVCLDVHQRPCHRGSRPVCHVVDRLMIVSLSCGNDRWIFRVVAVDSVVQGLAELWELVVERRRMAFCLVEVPRPN